MNQRVFGVIAASQVLRAQLESVVLTAGNQHRLTVGQRDDVGIADPARAWDDDLVTGVQP